jgi:hypothetical protein
MENQSHCIKNRKFLIATLIQNVLTTVVPMPKPRAIPEDVRCRIIAERGRKRREQQCRIVVVARDVLAYRDPEAAKRAAEAQAAAEAAAQAAVAADGERVERPYQVFVKREDFTAKTITLWVVESDTIKAVKDQIQEKEDIPVEMQRIEFADETRDDAVTLKGLGATKESTLHVFMERGEGEGAQAATSAAAAAAAATAATAEREEGKEGKEGKSVSREHAEMEQDLLRRILDSAAQATCEFITEEKERAGVFDTRFVPLKLKRALARAKGAREEDGGDGGDGGGGMVVKPTLIGCVTLTFKDPDTARKALQELKPRAQVLGVVARPWTEVGKKYQQLPPVAGSAARVALYGEENGEEKASEDGGGVGDGGGAYVPLPQPDIEAGKEEEEKMAREATCIWDRPIEYALQESLMSTLKRLMEHFGAAVLRLVTNYVVYYFWYHW